MTAKKTKASKAATPAVLALGEAPAPGFAPLGRLKIAPENARFGRPRNEATIEAVATSIEGDRLNYPLCVYPAGDDFMVWDGGYRLLALEHLAANNRLPATYADPGVPLLIDKDAATARLRSMATFLREDIHPADEFLGYKAMLDEGYDVQQIAAVCAVDTRRVRQLLRLNGVAPVILDAFREGKLALDVVEAFTLTDDQERQTEAFHAFKKAPSAWDVKNRLRQGVVSGNDRWAVFVGEEAYREAGGGFLVDLFSNNRDDWTDRPLLERLAQEKYAAEVKAIEAEGWGWVKDHRGYEWNMLDGLSKVDPAKGKKHSAEEKAALGAVVYLDTDGKLVVKRGYSSRKASAAGGAVAEKPKTEAQLEPGLYGWTHTGHMKLTSVATEATKVALLRKPEAAYDGLLTHMAWLEFRNGSYDTPSRLRKTQDGYGRQMKVDGTDQFDAALSRWKSRLPTQRVEFCDYVADLTPAEKAELLALCFATTLDGVEGGTNARQRGRWAHLGWIAKHADADLASAWTPDAEFLKGGSKAALLAALEENGDDPEAFADAKKGPLVSYVTGAVEKGWRPKLLTTFTDVSDPAPTPKVIMSREAFEGHIVAAFLDQDPELDEEVLAAEATLCLDAYLVGDADDEHPLEYGDEAYEWAPSFAAVLASTWDLFGAREAAGAKEEAADEPATFPAAGDPAAEPAPDVDEA